MISPRVEDVEAALRDRHRELVLGAVATLAEREGQTTEEWLRAASATADDSDCDTNTMEAM